MKMRIIDGVRIPDGWEIVDGPHELYHTAACNWEERKIYKGKKDVKYPQIALAHEAAHARWIDKGLVASEFSDRVKHEIIAGIYELHFALKRRNVEEIKSTQNLIESNAFHRHAEEHTKAARRIMQGRLWERCKQFVKQESGC